LWPASLARAAWPRASRAEPRLPCAQHYVDRAAALTRRALPPRYGCFSTPRFQLLPALEALLGLLFANLFWVGLWDLLDNTIFPSENSVQMLSLVRTGCVSGLLGLRLSGRL